VKTLTYHRSGTSAFTPVPFPSVLKNDLKLGESIEFDYCYNTTDKIFISSKEDIGSYFRDKNLFLLFNQVHEKEE
jgi:hypothetical protein